MTQPRTRNLIQIVFRNFINSFKPRQINGTLMGTDHFGNKYFEIPANPSVGKRRTSRWFDPPEKDDFEQELPAEWEAWLRGRRKNPPTEEEVLKNVAIMQIKKKNAALIAAKFPQTHDARMLPKQVTGQQSFPKYDEYESMPGNLTRK